MSELNHDDRAQNGVRRRRSAWNLLLFVFGVQFIGAVWWGLFQVVVLAQAVLAPQKRFGQNMSNLGEVLMVVPLFLPALGVGMMAANLRVWLIPAARDALEQEAHAQPGAEFAPAMKHLAIATVVLLALAVPLSLLGAVDLFR
jgi:hypothetical protein